MNKENILDQAIKKRGMTDQVSIQPPKQWYEDAKLVHTETGISFSLELFDDFIVSEQMFGRSGLTLENFADELISAMVYEVDRYYEKR